MRWFVPFLSAFLFFFFNDTATTEIYTLSYTTLFRSQVRRGRCGERRQLERVPERPPERDLRSEEHTSELQSRQYLVCRLLLEKKKKKKKQKKKKKKKKTKKKQKKKKKKK